MSEIPQVPNCLMGIDVSHYQGVVDWAQVAAAGVKFTFIKATDGIGTDAMLKSNVVGAHKPGVPFGFYHFWRPQHPPELQAEIFLHSITEAIAQPEVENALEFAVALDIETGSLNEDAQDRAFLWLDEVSDATLVPERKPLIYVSPSYAKLNLTDPGWTDYPLWAAHYTDLMEPHIDKWSTWMFWQRGIGSIPGINTDCDVDWFHGSESDFAKLLMSLPT